jgi:hypothetical protein
VARNQLAEQVEFVLCEDTPTDKRDQACRVVLAVMTLAETDLVVQVEYPAVETAVVPMLMDQAVVVALDILVVGVAQQTFGDPVVVVVAVT